MKVRHTIALIAAAVAVSFCATLWSESKTADAAEWAKIVSDERIVTDSIRARSITIVDDDGREQIAIRGLHKGAGIWMGSGDKIVSIYNLPGQGPVIGLANKDPKAANVCPLALSLDKDGKPSIQFEGRDGKLHWIGPEELERAANKIP